MDLSYPHGSLVIQVHRNHLTFSSLWLKQVWDVDLSKHCINCLVGCKEPRVKARQGEKVYELKVDISPGIWYFCGVTYPYIWRQNAHLALVWREGSHSIEELPGCTVHVANFDRIQFSEDDIDPSDPNAQVHAFRSCRNWQFAHLFARKQREIEARVAGGR